MEQPNVTGDGDARLTPTFWLLTAATGIAAGVAGGTLMALLHAVSQLAFGHSGPLETAVAQTSDGRRVLVLTLAGLTTGVLWWLIRRFTRGQRADLDDAVWNGHGELSFQRSLLSSVTSEIAVGAGASLGREAAPKLMGAVAGSVLARWRHLSPGQQRLLVACGGGAGMAAVYNVPLGGALISAEILYGSLSLPVVLPALLCSCIATATAWLFLSSGPTYSDIPAYTASPSLLVWSAVIGPVIGVLAVAYIRLIGIVSHHRARGWVSLVAMPIGFAVLGVVGIAFPQLFGNGKDMAHDVLVGEGSLALLAALAILKPLVTVLCLGTGATGGLFTPTMSTGAVLGGSAGIVWSAIWPGTPVGAFAVIGAAAMIGAGTQAPLSALVLMLELTQTTGGLIVPMIIATVIATAVSRHLDGYSIYSARLPA